MTHLERWTYRLRATVEGLGPVGGIGIALLTGCAVYYMAAVVPAREQLTEIRERRASEELARRSGKVPLDTQQQLREFITFFPEVDTSSRWLALIFTAAREEGIELARGTYNLQAEDAVGLSAYQVTLPVRGSYPSIRRFLSRVLTSVPAASLDSVVFRRERASEGTVDAQIVLALHLRAASGTAPQTPDAPPPTQEAAAGERVAAATERPR